MTFDFSGEAISWRGPAPFVFVPTPPEITVEIKAFAKRASYGWGCIPVRALIGATEFTTSLFPRDGVYMVPVKVVVQKAEGVEVGSHVEITMEVLIAAPDW